MKNLLVFTFFTLCHASNLVENSTSPIITNTLLYNKQTRILLKAHAILMILGWLLFVPTGFLFARLGRDLYKDKKLFGSPVWFKVAIAVGCVCLSMLCVFVSQEFRWRGSGSDAKYWTHWHANLGVISSVFAIAQPINSLFRCAPTHAHRVYFNWAHRIVGMISYILAFTTLIIAALVFRLIWSDPLLQVFLISIPTILSIMLNIAFRIMEGNETDHEVVVQLDDIKADASSFPIETLAPREQPQPHILQAPAIFMSIGVFTASVLVLSLLVVNGFKNF